MQPNDLVIYLPSPLMFGGELRVIEVTITDDGVSLLCEQVNYEPEHEDDVPPRGIFAPHDLELASWWARAA